MHNFTGNCKNFQSHIKDQYSVFWLANMEFVTHGTQSQTMQPSSADSANKQLQPHQQLKPQNLLDVPSSKSPKLINSQRSPGPSQSNTSAAGVQQKQNNSQLTTHGYTIAASLGQHGNAASAGATQPGNVSIAAVQVEVGASHYKNAGGGKYMKYIILSICSFHCLLVDFLKNLLCASWIRVAVLGGWVLNAYG